MLVVSTVSELQEKHRHLKKAGSRTGFVPTMGALHPGHISLVEESVKGCEHTIVSIFVNPTQFNNPDDFKHYPVTIESDLSMLREAGVDLVFMPEVKEMYPEDDKRVFDFGGLDEVMEGKFRPGHFNGVGQIVSKLFDFVQPDVAYFGEKDFQQLAIIQYMTRTLNYPIEIVPVPTMRERDGLAMSSRNMRLTANEREQATLISRVLFESKERRNRGEALEGIKAWAEGEFAAHPLFELEYFEIVDAFSLQTLHAFDESDNPVACVAAHLGKVRLIDNMRL